MAKNRNPQIGISSLKINGYIQNITELMIPIKIKQLFLALVVRDKEHLILLEDQLE